MSNIAHSIMDPAERRKKEEAHPTFLDAFPSDVYDNEVRFMSRVPNACFWEPHVNLANLAQLLAVRGALRNMVKSRFDTLCVSRTKDLSEESATYGWKERNEPHLWTNKIDVAHKYVMGGSGQYLKTLVISIDSYDLEKGDDQLIDDFLTHCPNVKSLSIVEKDSSWANAFGKQLEKLEFSTTHLQISSLP